MSEDLTIRTGVSIVREGVDGHLKTAQNAANRFEEGQAALHAAAGHLALAIKHYASAQLKLDDARTAIVNSVEANLTTAQNASSASGLNDPNTHNETLRRVVTALGGVDDTTDCLLGLIATQLELLQAGSAEERDELPKEFVQDALDITTTRCNARVVQEPLSSLQTSTLSIREIADRPEFSPPAES